MREWIELYLMIIGLFVSGNSSTILRDPSPFTDSSGWCFFYSFLAIIMFVFRANADFICWRIK